MALQRCIVVDCEDRDFFHGIQGQNGGLAWQGAVAVDALICAWWGDISTGREPIVALYAALSMSAPPVRCAWMNGGFMRELLVTEVMSGTLTLTP
jgi:hypothetical protein